MNTILIKHKISFCLGILLIGIVFLPSYIRFQRLRQKAMELDKKIAQLEKENSLLRKELSELENDPLLLERIARDKIGMIKKGEFLYRFSP